MSNTYVIPLCKNIYVWQYKTANVSLFYNRVCLHCYSIIHCYTSRSLTVCLIIVKVCLTIDAVANLCYSKIPLTHWGQVTHICVGKLTIIGSDNGLSPGRCQAIIWTNAGILLTESLGINFSETLIRTHAFSFTKMHLKMSSAKWCPFCLDLNVLTASVTVPKQMQARPYRETITFGIKQIHQVLQTKEYLSWWRHQMETFSVLLAICVGNSTVTGEFPTQRPVTWSFDVFFGLHLINGWVINHEAGDLRCFLAHYDVTVMLLSLVHHTNNWEWSICHELKNICHKYKHYST